MKYTKMFALIIASLLSSVAPCQSQPFLVSVRQPFVNPDIPSNLMVEELNLTSTQVRQLSDLILSYRQQRRDLSPGYENKHRSILQGSQASDAQMINLIVKSGREIAAILKPPQLKKVPYLALHAEAIASLGYPLAMWEMTDYSETKQAKLFEIGQVASDKLRKAPPSARDAIVAEGWNKLKSLLSKEEYSTLTETMRQHAVTIPGQ